MATFLISMFSKFQKKSILIFFFVLFDSFSTSSFAKVNISKVKNEIFILDIYGKRYTLDNTKQTVTQPNRVVNGQITAIGNPPVKKSDNSGICWVFGNESTDAQYNTTSNYTPYNSLQECLDSGGRLSRAG